MPSKRGLAIDSPFSGFVEANRVPSLLETKAIQELLAEKTAQLARLNSEVPRRKTGKKLRISRELRTALDLTRRSIKYHQALIAPWRRLPLEIMGEIFAFALNRVFGEGDWIDDRSGTLLLCKICKQWREIALSTPALWTVLAIRLKYSSKRQPLNDMIPVWLERSRSLPLYLQIVCDPGPTRKNEISGVLSSFASALHRMHTLILSQRRHYPTSPDVIFPTITFPTQTNAPLLTTLHALLPTHSYHTGWDWVHQICNSAPRLRSLNLSAFVPNAFPLSHLTTLHITSVAMDQVFRILQDGPNIEELTAEIQGDGMDNSPGNINVQNALSRININAEHGHVLGQFFDCVELPNLKGIVLQPCDSGPWPESQILSLLSRSTCSLEQIYFFCNYSERISDEQIIACLSHKACDSIESISIAEPDDDFLVGFRVDTLVKYLTYQGPFVLPALRKIDLLNVLATDGLIATLAESRILPSLDLPEDVAPPAQLTHFFLYFGDTEWSRMSNEGDKKRLQDLRIAYPEIVFGSSSVSSPPYHLDPHWVFMF